MSRRRSPLLLAGCLLLLVTPIARPGARLEVESWQGDVVGGEVVAAGGDELVLLDGDVRHRLGWDEVFRVLGPGGGDAGAPAGEPPVVSPRDLLLLASEPGRAGDRLWGRLAGGDEVGLRFAIEGGLVVSVPFEHVGRLLPDVDRPIDRLQTLTAAGFDDRIWRRREDGGLDGVSGIVARVDAHSVLLDSSLGELTFELADVLAMVLAGTVPPDPPGAGRPARVRLSGGSLFDAGLLETTADDLVLATAFGTPLRLPWAALDELLLRPAEGTPRAWSLAGLEPMEVEEWSSLGGDPVHFPWRTDLGVAGGPLSLAGRRPVSGLGVHANARLVYAVPEGARTLRVAVGLTDDVLSLPAEGTVVFEIVVDGTTVARTEVVREGEPPRILRVDGLDGAERVELVTLDAGDLDAGDRAAWIDGVFLGER